MGTATISNKRLGIGDIVLTFKIISPSTLPNVEVKLDGDKAALPYGTITEIDTTVLPGYVRLQINNSDLKIMERTLIIDGIEHPWSSVPKEALLLH